MGKKNNGGTAFPAQELNGQYATHEMSYGMTLRDYFAAKAMVIFISLTKEGYNCSIEEIAKYSYKMADAMILEREKNNTITCKGAGQCDHSGIDCTPDNNCGEYEE